MTQPFAARSNSQSVNVYLKFSPDNNALKLIKDFNRYLGKNKIFSHYRLTPFLVAHPLHLTLYLTNYNPKHLPQISQRIQRIAKQTKPIIVKTGKIEISSSRYTMLSISNSKPLQALSNKVVIQLMAFRDQRTPIPSWVKNNAAKRLSFLRFGSPNVFANFSPHFSIFAADHLTSKDAKKLQEALTPLLNQFNSKKSALDAQAIAIGIGLADAQGQIMQELYAFPLAGLNTFTA
ncbi:2'-5' RNA ligase family protein [Legionella clemsonensis]|uniref:2',5' RNA ligase family n=1 Tax=Legionella clemsonensis TaxID=1867846 RepID=A0A222NZ08_9GAMM|nr:2'-5' RNA ligase family protein [Legionella clemsonensis]ASQ44832.1 hypothetical protein clem_01330 [Legionella clemsonensis]